MKRKPIEEESRFIVKILKRRKIVYEFFILIIVNCVKQYRTPNNEN